MSTTAPVPRLGLAFPAWEEGWVRAALIPTVGHRGGGMTRMQLLKAFAEGLLLSGNGLS